MTLQDSGTLLLLSALWGGSFLFMRIAAPALGPILLIELRVGIAAMALLSYGRLTRRLPRLGQAWRKYLVVGVINSALPFVLISTAELHLPASVAAILNATTPLFGALAASLWLGERLTPMKLVGLLMGFAGVVVMVGLFPMGAGRETLLSVGASLLAAISYGVAAVYTKRALPGGQPFAMAAYSQLFAALALLPMVPFSLPQQAPSGVVVGSVLALALLSTAFAYLLYFRLIVSLGPTKAIMVTYLAPAFGMLWGWLFLQESLGLGTVAGFGLILASVAVVTRPK